MRPFSRLGAGTDLLFVFGVWLVSRVAVVYTILAVAPGSPVPLNGQPAEPGWNAFLYLDGPYYAAIGAHGYEYAADGRGHNIAFFPFYPLLVSALMRITTLPFAIVGVVVSNVAFLLALFAIFAWARERHSAPVGRWTVLTLCCLPLSIFGSLAYTEGLFMLLSTLALRDFDRERFVTAGIWGGLASATRVTGAALVPAFLLGALLNRKPGGAYAALLAGAGIGAFAIYCWYAFGDPLAFVRVQTAWRGDAFGRLWAWQHIIDVFFGVIGPQRWPFQAAVVGGGLLWWRFRDRVPAAIAFVLGAVLAAAELHVWFESPTILLLIVVGAAAVVVFCARIGAVASAYALVGIGIILFAGFPVSADRIAYSIVPLSVALALVWDAVPGTGTVVLAWFAIRLPWDAIKIAQRLWWIR